jgi:hypothetical protein
MIDVIVTVAAEHRQRIEQVADALRTAGLQVGDVLEAIGQVTGSVREDRLDALRALDGVQRVDRGSSGFQIPPPDSPVQ